MNNDHMPLDKAEARLAELKGEDVVLVVMLEKENASI